MTREKIIEQWNIFSESVMDNCSGCIREGNKSVNIDYLPKFSSMQEAIEYAQKCPKGKCIYDDNLQQVKLDEIEKVWDAILEHKGIGYIITFSELINELKTGRSKCIDT